ncbi:MAG: hydrogenase, partial [Pirellulaceae bacterium]|nr:hydrogenase [Pirellulaceae bacterium]
NVIERAMILTPGSALTLPEPLKSVPRPIGSQPSDDRVHADRRAAILAALEATGWKIKGPGNAAERLGLKPSTLRYRMKSLGIQRPTDVSVQA